MDIARLRRVPSQASRDRRETLRTLGVPERILDIEGWRRNGPDDWDRLDEHVYFAEAVGLDRIKIGWAGGDPRVRIAKLGNACPVELRLILAVPGPLALERWFHVACNEAWVRNEWFAATPEMRTLIALLQGIPHFGSFVDQRLKR